MAHPFLTAMVLHAR